MYIADMIKPMLAGLGPDVQGAILVELVSIYFAGMHPLLREQQLKLWTSAMHDMIEINAEDHW